MSQVDQLYRLQQIEDEIREGKKRLTEVVRLQSESQELIVARARTEAASATLQEWRSQHNDLNLELNSLNSKAKRSEDRLYSGTVKNPKELADLQHELESLSRRRVSLEDEVLEAMIMLEEAQEEDAIASATYESVVTQWEDDQQNLRTEEADLVQSLSWLNKEREQQLEKITPQSMRVYETAARRLGDIVVVALNNERCRGCLVRVPSNLVKAADEGKLVTCDNCGRILVPR